MKKNRKKVLWISAIVAVALVVCGIGAGMYFHWGNRYERYISSAEKLAETGSYSEAVLAYQNAIDEDPENVEAYLGLSDLYVANGDTDSAISLLNNALLKTNNSSRIKLALNQLMDSGSLSTLSSGEAEPVIDEDFLSILNGYSYGDYSSQYGIESRLSNQDGSVTVRVRDINADYTFANTSSQPNAVSATVISADAMPAYASMDDILSVFSVSEPINITTLESLKISDFNETSDNEHAHLITFTIDDDLFTIETDGNGYIQSGAYNTIEPGETNQESIGNIPVTGEIIDAQTGVGVENVTITVREGASETGNSITEVSADLTGRYTLNLPSGQYTFEVGADGYTTIFRKVYIGLYDRTVTLDLTLSKDLSDGTARIVLEWGATPTDLDSYLRGTDSNGNNVFVSFFSKQQYNGNNLVAELDLDDTSSYGPETTTIYDLGGSYNFTVADYRRTGTMNNCGATVTVYLPNQNPQTITIGGGIDDDQWCVLTLINGELTVYNDGYSFTSGWTTGNK